MDREAAAESLKRAEREALACEKAHFVEMCEYQQYEETIVLVDEHMHYLADDDGNDVRFGWRRRTEIRRRKPRSTGL